MTDLQPTQPDRPVEDLQHPEESGGIHRRAFLQAMGAAFGGLTLAGCQAQPPDQKIIPFLQQPEESIPGLASWYASTCGGCAAACGVLVKSRDGRPIKMEGNPEHPLNQGGLCARGQATVLDLYDSHRFKEPSERGKAATWEAVDAAIVNDLRTARKQGGGIRILSRSMNSPTLLQAVQSFVAAYPQTRHIQCDPISYSPVLDAHYLSHGRRLLPWYRFERAKTLVAVGADFLGTWVSPVEYSLGWSRARKVNPKKPNIAWHAQIEARMSLTGANADIRVPLAPSGHLAFLLELGGAVVEALGVDKALPAPGAASGVAKTLTLECARRLVADKGRGLVLTGSSDVNAQLAVNVINQMLDNYGHTLEIVQPSLQVGDDRADMDALIDDMAAGNVTALILLDRNPAYDDPRADEFRAALKNVPLTVSLADRADETTELVRYSCPDHHALESWGDSHPHVGLYSLRQPLIAPLYKTRAAVESLLAWSGKPKPSYESLRSVWLEHVFPVSGAERSFESFWTESVRMGFAIADGERIPLPSYNERCASRVTAPAASKKEAGDFEFVAYPSIALYDGTQANNPWLQELPDPISRATWGNYASLSPATAKALGVVEGRLVKISAGKHEALLPAQVQVGMPDGVIAGALGYGRSNAGQVAANFPTVKMFPVDRLPLSGADVYPLSRSGRVQAKVVEGMSPLAKTQQFDFQTVPFTGQHRPLSIETTPEEVLHENHDGKHADGHEAHATMWPGHEYKGHKWGLTIDANACTGCAGCVVACQAENNIPVVGKAEVAKSREMHWLRIDRYYSGSEDKPDEAPSVGFMPMMCQHCDNAPCETVCPVLATLHSTEGLNMQVYNRCVGTRYCANNCPYKVRRFNWFDYSHNDLVQNLVLNPDITVRMRGIMEKCSLCAQRITEGKILAKSEGRVPLDGEIQPACAQSCPTKAIQFGDLNNPASAVARGAKDIRSYRVLEEIGTQPSIHYLKKVRHEKE